MLPRLLFALVALALIAPALSVQGFPAAPTVVDLGAPVRALAMAGDGSLLAFATSDGVVALSPSGTVRWRALDGLDVRSVAVDFAGATVVAGDSLGLVHVLRGDGSEAAASPVLGAVTAVAVSDDGRFAYAGTDQHFAYHIQPGTALPPPLPNLGAAPVVLPQWSYDVQSAVKFVVASSDGTYAAFATEGNAPVGRVWDFTKAGALLPGGLGYGPLRVPCFAGSEPLMKCWSWQQFAGNAEIAMVSAARATYDMVTAYTHGFAVTINLASGFANPWNFQTFGSTTAARLSPNALRAAVGDSAGNLYYMDTTPASGISKKALWTAALPGRVAHLQLSDDGGLVAAADTSGRLRAFTGAGAAALSYDAGGALVGLVVAPDGSGLAAAQGNSALVWA